jgi:hypothetical protein
MCSASSPHVLRSQRKGDAIKMTERIKRNMQADKPMTLISLRLPDHVIEDLKEVAPSLGFGGYQALIRAYISMMKSAATILTYRTLGRRSGRKPRLPHPIYLLLLSSVLLSYVHAATAQAPRSTFEIATVKPAPPQAPSLPRHRRMRPSLGR